jgi:predicted ATPase/class 3 adenylate cyclase
MRSDLPRGTVTFLFTDIEGSTRLLHELGPERFAEALAHHRRVLRERFAALGGVEVDTQGDAFFYVFSDAAEALSAAEAGQAALRDAAVRVRIGLHTGEPLVVPEGYVGLDVHKAARVAAVVHGGQIVASESTRLASERDLKPLGTHRLKDLAAPEPLWQLGEGDFPPLRSLHQTNLPVQPTPLVGRQRELRELAELVASARLVTLVGPGGAGKTRLALQVAAEAVDDFSHGVWWVPLQAVRHPDEVEAAIAEAVGAKDAVLDHFAGKRLLVLLDNFEHLTAASGLVAGVLAGTHEVRVVVTSREPLRIAGEEIYIVEALPEEDAVSLFVERSGQAEPRATIHEICRRLDGLPLAIELAAARSALFAPDALLARLQHRLPLLTGGRRDAPARQRTLRATIEWSHDLLDDDERRLFRRLAAFAGSFDVEAAEEVCGAELDSLQSLLEKSLLRRWGSGRFGMLETIHEFASERLTAAGEAQELATRHADHYLAFAERAAREVQGHEQAAWLDRLAADDPNFAAALDRTAAQGAAQKHLRLAAALAIYWLVRARPSDARRRFADALAIDGSGADPERAALHRAAGRAALAQGALDDAAGQLEQAIVLFGRLNDQGGAARAQSILGDVYTARGDYQGAWALLEQSLETARQLGFTWLEAASFARLGSLALTQGDHELAVATSEQALATLERVGDDDARATVLANIALARLEQHRYAAAREVFLSSLQLADALGDREIVVVALIGIAATMRDGDDLLVATRLLATAERVLEEMQVSLTPAEGRVRRELEARLVRDVPKHAYEVAWAEGRAADLDAAIRIAMDLPPAPTGRAVDG